LELSPSAYANQIRIELEYLLDPVPMTKEDGNGKSSDLKLYDRINIFTKNELVSGKPLMALIAADEVMLEYRQ